MTDNAKNSKRLYKDFIKEKGIFAYMKGRKDEDREKDGKIFVPKKSFRYYLFRYVKEYRDQKWRLILVLFLGLGSNILGLAVPWTSKIMLDNILPRKDFTLLIIACALLFLTVLLRNFVSIFEDYFKQVLRGRFIVNLKQHLIEHLHILPLVELQKLKTGGIITRLQDDTEMAGSLLFNGLLSPFNAFIMLFFAMSSLFFISWKTTIVCIVFSGLMCGIAYFFFYVMRPFQKSLCQDKALINASLTESFGGIQVVKSFCRESTVRMDYTVNSNLLWRKTLYAFIAGGVVHRGIWFIHLTTEISIWLIGGYYYINGTLSIGSVVVFITFLMWIFQPIFMIMSSVSETQRCFACAERTIDLLDMKPDMNDRENALPVKSFSTELRFNNVIFKYPDGSLAVDNIKLSIPKGKVTALVGPSGGGKTTITNLVLRFYDVSDGSITLDGTDIRDIRLADYRKLMSLVLQDVFLFDGTVRENIMFGKKDASQDEIEHAAKVAHCDEFILKLKDGYETVVGERGIKLSGGQKQRLALARAIVADPQVLILDEATSNLDSESESLIQDALKNIFRERTSIVIAHRLSTIMDADNIIVIDKGAVVEQGKHEELLAQKGIYYEMYSKQMEKAINLKNIWAAADSDINTESDAENR